MSGVVVVRKLLETKSNQINLNFNCKLKNTIIELLIVSTMSVSFKNDRTCIENREGNSPISTNCKIVQKL